MREREREREGEGEGEGGRCGGQSSFELKGKRLSFMSLFCAVGRVVLLLIGIEEEKFELERSGAASHCEVE